MKSYDILFCQKRLPNLVFFFFFIRRSTGTRTQLKHFDFESIFRWDRIKFRNDLLLPSTYSFILVLLFLSSSSVSLSSDLHMFGKVVRLCLFDSKIFECKIQRNCVNKERNASINIGLFFFRGVWIRLKREREGCIVSVFISETVNDCNKSSARFRQHYFPLCWLFVYMWYDESALLISQKIILRISHMSIVQS